MRAALAALAALALLLVAAPAVAQIQASGQLNVQNYIVPTPPVGDSSNRSASTAFVQATLATAIPLATGQIFIGNAGGLADRQTPSGDCTISLLGVVVCTQSAGAFTVNGTLTVGTSLHTGTAIFNAGATVNGTLTVNGVIIDTSGNVSTAGLKINGVLQPAFSGLPPSVSNAIVYRTFAGLVTSSGTAFPNQMLQSGFGNIGPAWSQATWPANVLSGQILGSSANGAWTATSAPVIGTSITAPLIAGGTGAGSTLTLESTSGAGTTDSIIVQTGSQVFAGGVNTGGQWTISPTNAPPATGVLLTLNKNTVAVNTPPLGTLLQVQGADATKAAISFDGFGTSTYAGFNARQARGTAASPTATTSGDITGYFQWSGYNSNAAAFSSFTGGSGASLVGIAAETWSGATTFGMDISVKTTPKSAGQTAAQAARFFASGGFGIGASVADPGIGAFAATGLSNTATTSAVCYNTATGLLTYDGTIGTCTVSSERFKHDIHSLFASATFPLAGVLRMRPTSFLYNAEHNTPGEQVGMIAEDVERIDPRLVAHDDDGKVRAISYLGPMTAYLVGAIQQQFWLWLLSTFVLAAAVARQDMRMRRP